MKIQPIQSAKPVKSLVKKITPKALDASKKLSQICFTTAVTVAGIDKAANLKRYSGGGSVCSSSYSIEAPDLYTC